MRLQEAAVLLRLDLSNDRLDRLGEPSIDPAGNLGDRHGLCRLKHEEADNALHPGRAALRVCRDNDIVGARYVMSPASAVDYPGAVFALGRRDEHPDPFSLRDDS